METLEKFRSYKKLFILYRTTRFGILKFAGLSALIVLLGIDAKPEWHDFMVNFIIIFSSVFVFRWMDDAWSFYLDRENYPERIYVNSNNIRSFFTLGALIYILYQSGLFLYSLQLALTMLILFGISFVFYFRFFRNKLIMPVIPLLKYPVFIWCISGFSLSFEVICLSLGAFFIMSAVDLIQKYPSRNDLFIAKLALLGVSGILVFQPFMDKDNILVNILMILFPMLFLLIRRINTLTFFPIIIYPILHMIDILLQP